MTYERSQVAFVDIETTGLDPEFDDIWEIAVIVDDASHVWQQRIPSVCCASPDCPNRWDNISPWVLENTGIRDRYQHGTALTGQESLMRLRDLISGRHVIGACPWFDSERLHRDMRRYDLGRELAWHYHLIDVEALAVGFLRGWRAAAAIPDLGQQVEPYGPPGTSTLIPLPWESDTLSRLVGIDPDEFQPKHSALQDARWARAIWEAIAGPPADVQ